MNQMEYESLVRHFKSMEYESLVRHFKSLVWMDRLMVKAKNPIMRDLLSGKISHAEAELAIREEEAVLIKKFMYMREEELADIEHRREWAFKPEIKNNIVTIHVKKDGIFRTYTINLDNHAFTALVKDTE